MAHSPLPGRFGSSLVVALLLAGCGSGGSSDPAEADLETGPEAQERPDIGAAEGTGPVETLPEPSLTSEGWGDYGPFEDDAARARERYSGSLEPAVLTLEGAAALFDPIVRGPFANDPSNPTWRDDFDWLPGVDGTDGYGFWIFPHSDELSYSGPSEGDVESCGNGGTRELVGLERVAGDRTRLLVTVRYENCEIFDAAGPFTLDGTLRRTVRHEDDDDVGFFVAFESLTRTSSGQSRTLDGAAHVARGACGEDGRKLLATLSITAPGDDVPPVLVDDLVAELVGYAGHTSDSCSRRPVPNRWSGVLAHAIHGRVELSTPTPLRERWDRTWNDSAIDPALAPGDGSPPGLELRGANERSARLEIRDSGLVDRYGGDLNALLASLRVIDAGTVVAEAADTARRLANGSLSDLGDADGDGLPNSWEVFHGLDPSSPDDAVSDEDGDGLNALEEYLAVSDPTHHFDEPLRLTREIEVSPETTIDPDTGESSYAVTVRGRSSSGEVRPRDDDFTLSLSDGAAWVLEALPEACEPIDDAVSTVRCAVPESTYFEERAEFEFDSIRMRPGASSGFGVEASYAASPGSFDVPSERSAIRIEPVAARDRPTDFAVWAPEQVFGTDEETRTIEATITQPAPAAPTDVTVEVEVPDSLVVRGAELFSDGRQALISRCTIGEKVACTMDAVRYVDTLTLSIDYRAAGREDGELVWRVLPPGPETDSTNDVRTTRVVHQGTMATLQALIDSAADGDTVEFPPGTYAGTLDGRSKRIDVRGASGDEPTVLATTDPTQPLFIGLGTFSTWSGLELRTVGGPLVAWSQSFATLADNLVAPLEGVAHRMSGIFGASVRGPYLLAGNTFTGWGSNGNGECLRIVHGRPDGGASVVLRGNLFTGNRCGAVIETTSGTSSRGYRQSPRGNVIATNNTFVGESVPFRFDEVPSTRSRHALQNNVVVGAETPVDIVGDAFTETPVDASPRPAYGLHVARNLVWDSSRGSVLTGTMANLPGVFLHAPDLNRDPAFADEATGDYRPSALSPLVDAGIDPEPLLYYPRDGGPPFEVAPPVPVDGDLDGTAQHDIGAFEFVP